jgi:hypothetical protein
MQLPRSQIHQEKILHAAEQSALAYSWCFLEAESGRGQPMEMVQPIVYPSVSRDYTP